MITEQQLNSMPGMRFQEIMDECLAKNPDSDVNDFFDAMGVGDSRSDFAFACCLKQIREYNLAKRDYETCKTSRRYLILQQHLNGV